MPRDTDAKPPQIVYIGRADTAHDKLWQQFQAEGIGVGIARTQRAGLQLAWDVKPLVVVINTANGCIHG